MLKKKSIILLQCFLLIFCVSCSNKKYKNSTIYDNDTYIYKVLSENEIALGDLKHGARNTVYFIPDTIDGYRVTQLGYPSGLVSRGNGNFSQDSSSNIVNRFYYPSSIERIFDGYLSMATRIFDVMYCGTVLDLARLDLNGYITYYVPNEDYDLYREVFSGKNKDKLKVANLVYDLNYGNKNVYYVDYVDDGIIKYVPPVPTRDGYSFDGWYTDEESHHKGDFSNDLIEEKTVEVRLYAKWLSNEAMA